MDASISPFSSCPQVAPKWPSTLAGNHPVKPLRGSSRIGVDLKLRFAIAEHRSDTSPLDHVFRDFQIHGTAGGGTEEHQAGISLGRRGNCSESRGVSRRPFGIGFRTESQHLQINPIEGTPTFNPRRESSKNGPHRRMPVLGSNCPSSEMSETTASRPTKISTAWQRVFAAGPKWIFRVMDSAESVVHSPRM
jgi:hypothetical protein